MNATEAKTFEHKSIWNAATVEELRPCGCKAYKDIFTYKRWQAQGFQVMKGEVGTRITTFKTIYKTDEETGEKIPVGKRPWTSVVFCRCQVKPK